MVMEGQNLASPCLKYVILACVLQQIIEGELRHKCTDFIMFVYRFEHHADGSTNAASDEQREVIMLQPAATKQQMHVVKRECRMHDV